MIDLQINDTQATLLREILQFHQVEIMLDMIRGTGQVHRQQCIKEVKDIQSILKILE